MIVVRFREYPGAKIERIEIPETKDPFEVLEACIRRIDALAANEYQPAQVPAKATSGSAARAAPLDPARAGVRDASIIAYRSLEWSGRMTRQQRLVMDFFACNAQRDYTRQELASALSLGINVIAGRVNELLKQPFNLLEELPRRKCRITGESAHALRAALAMRRAA